MMSLRKMRVWHIFATHFCMWGQHIVCLTVVEEEKKVQIHDQNGSEPNRYMSSKDIRDRQNSSRVLSPCR
jgi:hypothetical protein